MGVGFYPIFRPRVEAAEFDSDGKLLALVVPRLDEIAVRRGLAPLMSFMDNRVIPEELWDEDPDKAEELLGEWDEWFRPADGLPTIRGLIDALQGGERIPGSEPVDDTESILADLKDLEQCLQAAEAAGAEFRFDMA